MANPPPSLPQVAPPTQLSAFCALMANAPSATALKPMCFTEAQKAQYRIPPEATMFAWAFPLPHGSLGVNGFEPATPEEAAAVYGAFAFFKDADHIIALNAACTSTHGEPGSCAFAGPHRLHAPDVGGTPSSTKLQDGRRMREFLIETGRFQNVSMEGCKAAGVQYFWWLGPGEPIANESGAAWPDGCFVYLYPDGAEEFDCFLTAAASAVPLGTTGAMAERSPFASPGRSPISATSSPAQSPGHGIAAHFARRSLAQNVDPQSNGPAAAGTMSKE